MKITKRNGNTTMYDDEKVVRSILKANGDTSGEEISEAVAANIASDVFSRLTEESEVISTKEIRDCVTAVLRERGFEKTAIAYAEYKK